MARPLASFVQDRRASLKAKVTLSCGLPRLIEPRGGGSCGGLTGQGCSCRRSVASSLQFRCDQAASGILRLEQQDGKRYISWWPGAARTLENASLSPLLCNLTVSVAMPTLLNFLLVTQQAVQYTSDGLV
jgi:hypothetical protein